MTETKNEVVHVKAEQRGMAGDMVLIAKNPEELEKSQNELIAWCDRKIAELNFDRKDLQENYDIAKKNKWRTSAYKRRLNICEKRIEYYHKLQLALQAGYRLIPNFPVDTIAMRTDRAAPRGKAQEVSHKDGGSFTQKTQTLSVGEGDYVDPSPYAQTIDSWEEDGTNYNGKKVKKKVYLREAVEHGEIDFPAYLAKPRIMKATQAAMDELVFDDIGILPLRKNQDPIVVGRIKDPRSSGWTERFLTFLICWFVDTKDL